VSQLPVVGGKRNLENLANLLKRWRNGTGQYAFAKKRVPLPGLLVVAVELRI